MRTYAFLFNIKKFLKRGDLKMIPDKLKYLDRIQKFINVLVESAKTDKINEMEFYMLLSTQCKAKSKILHYQKRG